MKLFQKLTKVQKVLLLVLISLIFLGYLTISSASSTYATKSGLSGGTTTVSGGCITTGIIKAVTLQSSNYASGSAGTKIQLNNGVIDSKNFKIDSNGNVTVNGNITATSGKIAGFTINNNTLKGQQVGLCGLDGEEWAFWSGANTGNNALFRVGHDGSAYMSRAYITGGQLRIPGSGNFLIGTTNGSYTTINPAQISIYASANNYITMLADTDGNNFIELINRGNETAIEPSQITTPIVHQTSLAEKKKNFEKLNSGLEIIKDIDIYKYNLKSEEDETKEHIGFVIGDDFKYSKEITSATNDSVDIYSFISVCCKAIQEQQGEIEELKEQIKVLEER